MTAPVFGVDLECRYCHHVHAVNKPCAELREERTALGRTLRDMGMAKVSSVELTWGARALAWFTIQPQGREFTADDLTDDIGYPFKRAAVGAAFAHAARKKLIERAGIEQSSTPTSHASIIQVWRRR